MQKKWFFIFFLLTLILFVYSYLIWSYWALGHAIFITLLFLLVLSFPFFRHGPYYIHLAFTGMGYLSFLLIFTLLRDITSLTGYLIPNFYIHVASIGSLFFGHFFARRIKILEQTIAVPNFPAELDELRILQISDLHIGPTIGQKYVSDVVEKINTLNADIIALTGDIGDGPVSIYREAALPLAKLESKYGVFYVPGNHEYYWDANEWMNLLNNLKSVILLNRGKKVNIKSKSFFICGVSDPVGDPGPDLKKALLGSEAEDFKILLSHRPGIAFEAADLGIHLQLSGHTHGGQFFPWTIIVRFFHKHSKGLHRIRNLWLHVNVGTGSWGPMLRLGTDPEISLIKIVPSIKSLE